MTLRGLAGALTMTGALTMNSAGSGGIGSGSAAVAATGDQPGCGAPDRENPCSSHDQ